MNERPLSRVDWAGRCDERFVAAGASEVATPARRTRAYEIAGSVYREWKLFICVHGAFLPGPVSTSGRAPNPVREVEPAYAEGLVARNRGALPRIVRGVFI